MPIMNLIVLDDVHIVLNVREDRLPFFPMGGTFVADVPAINKKNIEFKINYVSPLGSFATWKSPSRQVATISVRSRYTPCRSERWMGCVPECRHWLNDN